MGGGNGKAVYLDTEGTFRAENIRRAAVRFGLDPEAALANVVYARAYNVDQLFTLITGVAALMLEEPCSLLIIDSIM